MAAEPIDLRIEEVRNRLKLLVGQGPEAAPTRGVNHLAVFALDLEATAQFYIDVMGMPVTGVSPNRDEPRSTHMNVDLGSGVSLSFFDFPHVDRLRVPAPEGVGGMMHVAIPIPEGRYTQMEERLDRRGIPYRRIDDSVYVRDPNGMTLELMILQGEE